MRWECWVAVALLTAGLAGCIGNQSPGEIEEASVNASAPSAPEPPASNASTPTAVVGVVDTGINPYHEVFRDDSPRAYQHPSTYIPDYPEDAEALNLTLDADSWKKAVEADCQDVWSRIETGELYWIPGTKIVGAISLDGGDALDCSEDPTETFTSRILDVGGHGTMTASRATSTTYGACQDCRVVAVEGFTEASVAWTGENADWIDVESHSWGPAVPAWVPTDQDTNLVNDPSFVETVEESAQAHPAFWASGNGVLTRGGLVGHPTQLDPRMTPSVTMVGGHDSGYVNTWPGFPPHVVSDSCNSWAAYHDSMNESDPTVGGGTSGATPYVAGKAAQLTLDARRTLGHTDTGVHDGVIARGTAPSNVTEGPIADGELTTTELETLFEQTAQQRPQREHADGTRCGVQDGLVLYSTTPVQWSMVPEEYPAYLHIGYGAVNNASADLAREVLAGQTPMPERPQASQFFEADQQAREQLYPVWTTSPGEATGSDLVDQRDD